MFRSNGHTASGPVMAPIFTEFEGAGSAGILTFLESHRATDGTTQSALLSIIHNLSMVAGNNSPLGRNCALMFSAGVAAAIEEAIAAVPADADALTDADILVTRSVAKTDDARVWIMDLVNASKKKELSGENVKGYYDEMTRSDIKGGPIASVINRVANFLPDLVLENGFRGELSQGIWNTYHTSRVSTGGLLWECRHVFIALGIYAVDDETFQAISDSKDQPWNVAISYDIPTRVVGYASLYFAAAGKDVGKWYQGEKYEADLPSQKVRAIKEIFKKYLELDSRIDAIDQSESIDALRGAVGDDFW